MVELNDKQKLALYKKSQSSGYSTGILEEVYSRGYSLWDESFTGNAEQFGFDRVNSFIAGGFAAELDDDLIGEAFPRSYILNGVKFSKAKRALDKAKKNPAKPISSSEADDLVKKFLAKGGTIKKEEVESDLQEKRGLWDNIHAKRERIKRGSGEKMRKPGSKGAPTAAALKASQTEEYTGSEKVSKNKNDPSSRFEGTTSLTKVLAGDTPGQSPVMKTIKKVVNEATYQGKSVPLNKPMKGDVKKSKVYVDPDGDGKAQKVNFGDKNMTIKKHIKGNKDSYCARSEPLGNDPTKANYWSRKAWDC